MENLKTASVKIQGEEYLLNEKDYGDMVVYDISKNDHYLLTLAADGSILFMNFDADEADKQVFKINRLNQFIEKIQAFA